ncbi:hypothetical protein SAMN05421853_1105 [Roseivivax halotolerans]|uniref:Uncharacterized protein n=2 Tax=Roseivivax halotolerans TaxID=93684 RepID=A0A1I5ZHJ6_9RHOB|nr:hypothetical protein SAMN05421853_1105 [Roseivivax halotolerans]
MALDMEERLAEGWDAVPPEDDVEPDPLAGVTDRKHIADMELALTWVPAIIAPLDPTAARVLGLHIQAKARRVSFRRLLEERGIARSSAYRLKDRALVMLSIVLDRRKIPVRPAEQF